MNIYCTVTNRVRDVGWRGHTDRCMVSEIDVPLVLLGTGITEKSCWASRIYQSIKLSPIDKDSGDALRQAWRRSGKVMIVKRRRHLVLRLRAILRDCWWCHILRLRAAILVKTAILAADTATCTPYLRLATSSAYFLEMSLNSTTVTVRVKSRTGLSVCVRFGPTTEITGELNWGSCYEVVIKICTTFWIWHRFIVIDNRVERRTLIYIWLSLDLRCF